MVESQAHLKERIRQFWDRTPCGAKDISEDVGEGSLEFFKTLERNRYEGDDFMLRLVPFQQWKNQRVLEIGCGVGTDLVRFARSGAKVCGLDASFRCACLTQRWLEMEGFPRCVLQADAEDLPFPDETFDRVYAWGVLHHTPDPRRAIREIARVLKAQGEILAMLYHRHSLVALQVWLRYGLFKGNPFSSMRRLIAEHMESPQTKAFSREETHSLFSDLEVASIRPVLTRYDLRLGRRRFLHPFFRRIFPSRWGWFLIVRAKKGRGK